MTPRPQAVLTTALVTALAASLSPRAPAAPPPLSPRAPADPPAEVTPLLLESALFRAHHDLDLDGLRGLLAPGVTLDVSALADTFQRQRARLLPADQIRCAREREVPTLPLAAHRGPSRYSVEFRCELLCRRGDYAVHLLLAPAEPLVVRDPLPATLLGLWLPPAAPAPAQALARSLHPPASPYSWWPPLLALAAILAGGGARRLLRQRPRAGL